MSVMDIKDVDDADHHQRSREFYNQICPLKVTDSEKIDYSKEARCLATNEMINEIHCMLLHLTKDFR